MKRIIYTVTMILMALAYPVYADGHSDTGPYAGIKTGAWKYTGDPQGTLNSSSMGIFAGYKLHPNLAVELDYLYNTEASASNRLENNSTQSNSYILAIRPILPLNQHWELFAKLGWEHYRYNQTITHDDGTSHNNTGEENAFSQGLGIAWNEDGYSIRAEFQTNDSFDFQVYSIGMSHTF